MSERGSFVSEFFYCKECFEAIKERLLIPRSKSICSVLVPSWQPEPPLGFLDPQGPTSFLPVIAGKLGNTYPEGEVDILKELLDGVVVCHDCHFAVVLDSGKVHSLTVQAAHTEH